MLVKGNLIGTNAAGSAAIGNGTGVDISGGTNTIGGTSSGARNVISGNSVGIISLSATTIEGNYIGTDVTGTLNIGNGTGVYVNAADHTIGGVTSGAGNLISGNGKGIELFSANAIVQGNYIGTNAAGTGSLSNSIGIRIVGSDNVIGGTGSGMANTIAFNSDVGVRVSSGIGNSIRQNSIHSNAGIGIDLTDGGNNNQAAPIVTGWSSNGGITKVWLSLTSTPSTTFSIDVFRNTVCDPSGFGEGQVFLGTATLATNAGGTGSVTAVFGVGTPLNQFITATATSPANGTSEFSNCRPFRFRLPATNDPVAPLPSPPVPPPGPPSVDGELQKFIFTPLPLAPITVANQRPVARFGLEREYQPTSVLRVLPSDPLGVDSDPAVKRQLVTTRVLARANTVWRTWEFADDLDPTWSVEP